MKSNRSDKKRSSHEDSFKAYLLQQYGDDISEIRNADDEEQFQKSTENEEDEHNYDDLFVPDYRSPLLCEDEDIMDHLPRFLDTIINCLGSPREKDIFILSTIVLISGCLHNVRGLFDGKYYYPNVFAYIIALSASGKGIMDVAISLLDNYHKFIRDESKKEHANYKNQLEKFKVICKNIKESESLPDPPLKPKSRSVFIPGDTSAAAIFQQLDANTGWGIIAETESDTLGKSLKFDWGNFSSLLRCSSQNERASQSRIVDDRRIEIDNPKFSVLLSGTPGQVKSIINSTENGLFSRFTYYTFEEVAPYRDVSPLGGKGQLPLLVKSASLKVCELLQKINENEFEVCLSSKQWEHHHQFFSKKQYEFLLEYGEESSMIVFRMGLIAFKICMVLTAIRKYEEVIEEEEIQCADEHFYMALRISEVLLSHSMIVFQSLSNSNKRVSVKLDPQVKKLYDAIPNEQTFERGMAIHWGKKAGLSIASATVDNYIKKLIEVGLITKAGYNKYLKLTGKD